MFRIELGGEYFDESSRSFVRGVGSLYETWDEAVEAAQEVAKLPPDLPWSVERVSL